MISHGRTGRERAPENAMLGASLASAFEAQAASRGDAVAVVAPDGVLSFAELDRRANGLARHLHDLGVGVGDRVAVRMVRGADAIVALFAVLKAGAAYVPVDPRYPEARQAFVMEDARVAVVLTQSRLLNDLAGPLGVPRVAVDIAPSWDRHGTAPPSCVTGSDDAVHVLYTSGSTGRPKGVVGRQAGTINRIAWNWRAYPFRAGEVMAQKTTLQFVDSILEIFVPLLAGVPIVVIPDEVVSDPRELVAMLAEHDVTRLILVPSILDAMLDVDDDLAARVPSLNYVASSGEALRVPTVRRFQAAMPGATLLNLYGASEVGDATFFDCAELAADATAVPLGYPLDDVAIALTGDEGENVGPGAVGEIRVIGSAVALGYHDLPEATAERFVSDADGAPVFRTGDLARWSADGVIEFHGRRDDLVKVRGNRVELGEVESVLRRHPVVTGASVALREIGGEPALVAYVVSSTPLDVAELRAYLRKTLPDYMIPAGVVPLAKLPLTPNGKVDRKALPPLDAIPLDEREYVAPADDLQRSLAALFEELLDRRPIGVTDDFFELGGHSLLAARAAARFEASGGARLTVRDFFEAPTVELLAERVRAAGGTSEQESLLTAVESATDADAPRPLSLVQQRMWLLERLRPGARLFNLPLVARLRGPLALDALECSVRAILERHEPLRSTFAMGEEEPYVRVSPVPSHPVAFVDLRAGDSGEAPSDEEFERVLQGEASRSFDIERGPLLRATLYRLGDEEHVLAVVIHHIVSDGLSIGLFCRELSAHYGAFCRGTDAGLPELSFDYRAYTAWERRRLTPEAIERELAYWRDELKGAPKLLDLPTDRPRRARPSMDGGHLPLEIDPALARSLRALAAGERASLFMVVLAAYQAVLGRHAGQDEVLVGAPTAGRTEEPFERLIGPFIKMLVLRGDLSGDPTFRELLLRTRGRTLGAYEHSDAPYEELVDEIDIERREGSYAPFFQALLVLEPDPEDGLVLEGLEVTPIEPHVGAATFDVSLYLMERSDGGVRGFLEYSSDLFDASTIQRLSEDIVALLAAAVARPDAHLADLFHDGSRTAAEVKAGPTSNVALGASLAGLFEDQAASRGEAVAVVAPDGVLSFAELDRRANGLARHLRELGVGVGDRVAVRMVRGADAIVALFAVLKAGAAYVPVDPRSPEARQAFVMEDARVAAVITQRALLAGTPGSLDVPLLAVDDPLAWSPFEQSALACATGPDDAVHVLYGSGSAGRPRGVVGRQAGTINRIAWNWRAYPFRDGEVMAQKTRLQFVDSILEIFVPLLAGVPIVVIPDDVASDPRELVAALARHSVTRLVLVPSLLDALLDVDEDLAQRVPSLRYVATSAEALRVQTVRRYQAALPGATLLNLYGSSEVGDATFFDCDELAPDATSVPLGYPLDDVAVMLVDEHGALVPAGAVGEIRVAGAAVALGYHDLPDATAERFLVEADRAPAFCTGDLARWSVDGALEFHGRRDDLVKIRGNRVELGEVESVLRRHPVVSAAAVCMREVGGEPAMVAYVVSSEPLDISALRDFLRRRLPDYMVPAGVVPLAKLPLTPNGKTDRDALPALAAIPLGRRRHVAPSDDLQRALVGLFEEILDRRPLGIDDDFFEIGGHSLQAARLFRRIEQRLHVSLPLAVLLEGATVEALAKQITAVTAGTSSTPVRRCIPVQPHGLRRPLFLVPGAGSRLLYLRHLARHLGGDQPLYALQDDPAVGEPVYSVEELATRYIDEIRAVQPRGPYALSGFSFGGIVAFEMAQQLVAAGETVAPLMLLDTFHPAYPVPSISPGLKGMVRRLGTSVDLLRELSADERITYLRACATVARERQTVAAWRRLSSISPLVARFWRDPVGDRERGWFARDAIALAAYVPAPYPGHLTYLRAEHNTLAEGVVDTRRAWSDLAPTTFVPFVGTHTTFLLEPLVRGVARQMTALLAAAQDED